MSNEVMSCTIGTMKFQATRYIKVNQSPRAIRDGFFKNRPNNDIIGKAIQSLDSLNDQIVNFVYSPRSAQLEVEHEFSPKDREALKASMSIMRRLLVDAQVRFRKMVEDNRKLATRIDGSIQTANKEMFMLRQELDDTNRRLVQIRDSNVVNGATSGMKTKRSPSNASVENMRRADTDNQIIKLKEENTRMESELKKLKNEISELRATKKALNEQPSLANLKMELLQYQNELVRAKDALQALKSDRKRLKAEKVDLLCQMKQLYESVEDKEHELREFIAKYEHQGKQSEQTIKQLESCEQEKWALIRRAQVAAENCVRLQAELNSRDAEMLILRHKLDQAQDQIRELSSETVLDKTSDSSRPDSLGVLSVSMRSNETMDTSERASSSEDVNKNKKLRKKKSSFGSLSKIFGKVKNRRSIAIGEVTALEDSFTNLSLDILSAENVNEKVQTARQLRNEKVNDWNAQQVLAWLEITMNMPQYGLMCARHVRSGKVLCESSDADLEAAFGMSDVMHRKKVRLALHDLKVGNVEYPKSGDLDPMWICEIWLPDIGLPQYRDVFDRSLVDGRVLINLTKREMEKHLGITDKLHQNSIMAAVELLRRVKCDKQVLSQRRAESLVCISNPLMWNNQQTREWLEKFLPQESLHDFKQNGLHGALLVLETSSTPDSLLTLLAISGDKKKKFSAEFERLIKPARASAAAAASSFERSVRRSSDGNPMKRLSLRGSLGRALGRKLRPSLPVQEENGDASIKPEKRSKSQEQILNNGD